ncbi:hypothetical protein OG413_46710 [Streptomyces sp. NBC_01433]|uniref:hypothetical protein n=1 Tax=Streptomyces sp. NBC_01433 TaxID=2903864 RepID=UPI0022527F50|nr:hypothetical protein [Streptomyces sp. NBC_01433]MCX4682641.1 hypothetical protein [Streptomyces sp. NBC_01433]MCX4682681.1 hypothetical protein [Streptomyces sp. NBC_01433]
MFTSPPDLSLQGLAHLNSVPLLCTQCDSGYALRIYKRGPREVFPASVSCLSCGHWEDCSRVITNGLVDAVLAARTGREKAGDVDSFFAEWRGVTMYGELVPEFVLDDAVVVLRALSGEVRKDTKRWWGGKKKAGKAQVKAKAGAVADAAKAKAGGAASAAKATALTTAWTLQTGGAGPTASPKPKTKRCTVKGCRSGMVTLSTKVHSATGKTREVKIPCGVCHRSAT